ncbi:MAG: hypothetical protein ACTHM6_08810 [Tepidisphaeraceae bacterium]
MLDDDVRLEGIKPLVESGMIEVRKVLGGEDLPPGSLRVEERVLARYAPPGATQKEHGVPPIGSITIPHGTIVPELTDEEVEEVRVLPFRFPWSRRAYALRCGERLCAVCRNVQPMEINVGLQGVVQFNDTRDWSTIFGRIVRARLASFDFRRPNGDIMHVSHEHIHFVGKVICWWDEPLESRCLV